MADFHKLELNRGQKDVPGDNKSAEWSPLRDLAWQQQKRRIENPTDVRPDAHTFTFIYQARSLTHQSRSLTHSDWYSQVSSPEKKYFKRHSIAFKAQIMDWLAFSLDVTCLRGLPLRLKMAIVPGYTNMR